MNEVNVIQELDLIDIVTRWAEANGIQALDIRLSKEPGTKLSIVQGETVSELEQTIYELEDKVSELEDEVDEITNERDMLLERLEELTAE